jgi:hypothetical protein
MAMRKIQKALLIGAFCCAPLVPSVAHAEPKPTRTQVQAVLDYTSKVLASTSTWYKKPLVDRLQDIQAARGFESQAEATFGTSLATPWKDCRMLAISNKFYLLAMNDIALIVEGRRKISDPSDMFAPMFGSVTLGEAKNSCERYLHSLP